MKRVLLTGMSGTGKSSVIRALAARGYKAVDTDDGWSEPLPDGRQRSREDAIGALLALTTPMCCSSPAARRMQAQFHPQFDHIILLSVLPGTLLEQLAARTASPAARHQRSSATSFTTC